MSLEAEDYRSSRNLEDRWEFLLPFLSRVTILEFDAILYTSLFENLSINTHFGESPEGL